MATLLGISFSTDENVVSQPEVHLLRKMVESLIVEFDQENFEKFLSSGSARPKAMWQYRKVSSETCSRTFSEITPEVAHTTAHNAKGATSEEVLKISRTAHAACVNVSQETRRAKASAHDQNDGEVQSCRPSSIQTLQFQVDGDSYQPLRLNRNVELRRRHRARRQ